MQAWLCRVVTKEDEVKLTEQREQSDFHRRELPIHCVPDSKAHVTQRERSCHPTRTFMLLNENALVGLRPRWAAPRHSSSLFGSALGLHRLWLRPICKYRKRDTTIIHDYQAPWPFPLKLYSLAKLEFFILMIPSLPWTSAVFLLRIAGTTFRQPYGAEVSAPRSLPNCHKGRHGPQS